MIHSHEEWEELGRQGRPRTGWLREADGTYGGESDFPTGVPSTEQFDHFVDSIEAAGSPITYVVHEVLTALKNRKKKHR